VKQNESDLPISQIKSKHLPNGVQFLVSADIYELADTTGALLLEVKARQHVVFPDFIHVKCYEIATINGVNGSGSTKTSQNFYKKINVNEHLSERNGFKLIRAFFNVAAQLKNVTERKCVISIGESDFDITYQSEDNDEDNSIYKYDTAKRSKKRTEYLKNNGFNGNKHRINFVLNVTEFIVGETLNGAYNWTDEPLIEMDVTSRTLLDKVKNRALNECQGHGVRVAERADKGGMLFLDTFYRRYVLGELFAKRIRVYVSLTTNPKRLSTLHYVLQTIDMRLVNNVFLTLPRKYRGKQTYSIPRKLAHRFRKLRFLSIDRDIGPAAKILPLVQFINSTMSSSESAAAVIISIDDDNVYDGSMVSTLVYYSLKCGVNCAIAASSQPVKYWNIASAGYPTQSAHHTDDNVEFSHDCKPTEVVEGFAGIAYRPGHFDLELFDSIVFARGERSLYESCMLSDDMLLSYVLSYSNVSLIGVKWYADLDLKTGRPLSRCGQYNVWSREELPFFNDTFAIHAMNVDGSQGSKRNMNRVKYKLCYQNLVKNFLDFEMESLDFKSRDQLISLFRDGNHKKGEV
jgi:hypothetical protein